jgi:ABC-type bacteriocin transporter
MDIRVKQRDLTDCGAACLASVAKFYGLDLSIAWIRQKAGTDRKGTSVLGLVRAAESFGFEARGVKGSYECLGSVPLPAIAHVCTQGNDHYVVISSLAGHGLKVMDPGDGQIHFRSKREFVGSWTGVLILLLPSTDFHPIPSGRGMLRRFWLLVRPHQRVLIQVLCGAIIYTVLGLTTSVYIQKIVDDVIIGSNYALLNLMSMSMIFLLLFKVSVGALKNLFILRTGQLIDARLILGYHKHLLNLPQQFFDSMRVGELTSRLSDAVKIRVFINDAGINLIVNISILVCSLVLMLTYYWKLGLIMSLIVPVYSLIYFFTDRLNKQWQRKLMEESAALEAQLVESLNSIGTIKRLGLEDHLNHKTEVKFIKLLRAVYASGLNSILANLSTEFVAQLFTIIILWCGTHFVLSQEVSPGELLSFYALIGYFTGPVSAVINTNKMVQDARIAADRLFELMDLDQEISVDEEQIDLSIANLGVIRFKEVVFRYGARLTLFENLNLVIPLKQMTAIVGESGCGKSTVAALLHKLYAIEQGNITVGDRSLKNFTTRSLRNMIGVVPQVTDLFSESLLYNIVVGKEEIHMDKVIGICRELGMINFIESLPDSFRTLIGENGLTLSGGQRQRIAIARALYRNPEILILDEATSSLDGESEAYVQRVIRRLLGEGKTVIVIAHRLSTIQNADKIIVMKKGKVVEEGSHASLILQRSEYHSLWSRHIPDR